MRTQRNVVDYFPHDARASEGDTLTILESRFGNDGYSFWFKLLERLSRSDDHFIDCRDPIKWQLMCAKANTTPEKALSIVETLLELNAIDKDLWGSRVIWCQKLVENLTEVYRNRKRSLPNKPIIMGDNIITTSSNPITTRCSTQSRVEYSKVEKSNILVLFDFWNGQDIIKHRVLTDKMASALKVKLENYSEEEIKKCISNYAYILHNNGYFHYEWTLDEFLHRGFDKYFDLEKAKQKYAEKKQQPLKTGYKQLPTDDEIARSLK